MGNQAGEIKEQGTVRAMWFWLRKERGRAPGAGTAGALTFVLQEGGQDDAEHGGEVVKERELDEGRGAAGEQVAREVHEREHGPAVQQEDEHRVQEVVVVHQRVHPAVREHPLAQRQTRGKVKGAAAGGQAGVLGGRGGGGGGRPPCPLGVSLGLFTTPISRPIKTKA